MNMNEVITTNKKKKLSGAVKHCAFGGCNSDSRAGRPGNRPGLKFVSFPKPCLQLRKLIPGTAKENVESVIKSHLKICLICGRCQDWMKCCRRQDSKWRNLSNITKDTYICEYHFVDVDAEILPCPRLASEIRMNEMKAELTRRLLPRSLVNPLPKKIELSKIPDFIDSVQGVMIGNNNAEHVEVVNTNTKGTLSDVDSIAQDILNDGDEEGSVISNDILTSEPHSTVLVGGNVSHQEHVRPTTIRRTSTGTTFAFTEMEILYTKIRILKERVQKYKHKFA